MKYARSMRLVVGVLGFALLAACDSAEERAEGHYQKGIELLEAGDVDRALVELRNVFNLDGNHRDARALYAATVLEQGQVNEAFGQYLRLVEQHPNDLEGRVVLANLAIESRQWQEAERHAAKAIELAPDDLDVQIIDLVMRYREAVLANDDATRSALLEEALEMQAKAPEAISLHNILIEGAVWRQDFDLVLSRADEALKYDPDNQQLYVVRLSALQQLGETAEIEQQLLALVEQFPETERFSQLILQFYRQQDEPEKAEAFLRGLVSPTDEDPNRYVAFVRYLRDTRGVEAALEELQQAQTVAPDRPMLRALEASLVFDVGRRDEGIESMQAIVDAAGDTEDGLRYKVALAQMLLATGNEVGARKLIEETLVADARNVEAIKLQASWLIDGDKPDEAIRLLRTALDEAPQDAELMTLIASAHVRNGDRALARDLLSLAAETSDFAPTESLRYAQVLTADEEYLAAEDVLINALRRAPSNVDLLNALGNTYVSTEDWSRAEHVERTLRDLGNPTAENFANGLRLAILNGQDRPDDALEFLSDVLGSDVDNARGLALSVQTLVRNDDIEGAREKISEAIARDPERFDYQFLNAAFLSSLGELDAAEQVYRDLVTHEDANERVWIELVRVLNRQGRGEEGEQMLDMGLEDFPEAPNLLWAKASAHEARNEFDAAIAIYEQLYAASSRSLVVANNLASLLSAYRGDEASVERAYQIARRLRGASNPAFQDTYGWLAFQRGNFDEALDHLEPAAEGLPGDPLVQFHLGMTYLAVNRPEQAAAQFKTALELAGPDDDRAQFDVAREELKRLEAESE